MSEVIFPTGKSARFSLNKWGSPPSVYYDNNRQYDRPKIFRELQVSVPRTIGILRDENVKNLFPYLLFELIVKIPAASQKISKVVSCFIIPMSQWYGQTRRAKLWLEDWKAHIVRAVQQDAAKSFVVDHLSGSQVLLIMDWAIKFLLISFRETQRDWFRKKRKILACDSSNHERWNWQWSWGTCLILATRINVGWGRVPHFVLFASSKIFVR